MPPFKIGEYYKSITSPGFCIRIKKITKRSPKEFQLFVDWLSDKNHSWASIGIEQDVVVNLDTFHSLWRKLEI